MATVPRESNTTLPTKVFRLEQLSQLSNQKKLGLILAAAAVIALLAGALMWSQTPNYRVLYNNVSDQDGAGIINALQQMNVPYKFSDSGGAILIPEKQVHARRQFLDARRRDRTTVVASGLLWNRTFEERGAAAEVRRANLLASRVH